MVAFTNLVVAILVFELLPACAKTAWTLNGRILHSLLELGLLRLIKRRLGYVFELLHRWNFVIVLFVAHS